MFINCDLKYEVNQNYVVSQIESLCDYYTSDLSVSRVIDYLGDIYGEVMLDQLINDNYNVYEIANDIIMKYGEGERLVKYHLAKRFIDNSDEVSLFEMKVLNSRLDYARINGSSYVYEIKTEKDSTVRLEKQISDYEKIFEHIYLVVHEKHIKKVLELTNVKIGIISFRFENGTFIDSLIRSAKINKSVQKKATIEQLTGQQLKELLKNKQISKLPTTVTELRKVAMKVVPKADVLVYFKEMTKKKYKSNWIFTRENFRRILPVDLQAAYSNYQYWNEFREKYPFRTNGGES